MSTAHVPGAAGAASPSAATVASTPKGVQVSSKPLGVGNVSGLADTDDGAATSPTDICRRTCGCGFCPRPLVVFDTYRRTKEAINHSVDRAKQKTATVHRNDGEDAPSAALADDVVIDEEIARAKLANGEDEARAALADCEEVARAALADCEEVRAALADCEEVARAALADGEEAARAALADDNDARAALANAAAGARLQSAGQRRASPEEPARAFGSWREGWRIGAGAFVMIPLSVVAAFGPAWVTVRWERVMTGVTNGVTNAAHAAQAIASEHPVLLGSVGCGAVVACAAVFIRTMLRQNDAGHEQLGADLLRGIKESNDRLLAGITRSNNALRDDIREGNAALRKNIHEDIAALRKDIRAGNAALRNDVRAGNAALRNDVRAGNATLQQNISVNNAALRTDMRFGNAAVLKTIRERNVELRQDVKSTFEELHILSGVTLDTCATKLYDEFCAQFEAIVEDRVNASLDDETNIMKPCIKCGTPNNVTRAHIIRGEEGAAQLFLQAKSECNWIPLCRTKTSGSCHAQFAYQKLGFLMIGRLPDSTELWIWFNSDGKVADKPFVIESRPHTRALHLYAAKVHLDCLRQNSSHELQSNLNKLMNNVFPGTKPISIESLIDGATPAVPRLTPVGAESSPGAATTPASPSNKQLTYSAALSTGSGGDPDAHAAVQQHDDSSRRNSV